MLTQAYRKPLPDITGIHAPYWEGTRSGELRLQRCCQCGAYWHLASEFCPGCLGNELQWTPACGLGTIAARIFVHQLNDPSFTAEVPYNVAWVELDEGPLMTANIVGAAKEDIRVGRRVQVFFDAVTPEVTIPRFRLA